MREIGAFEVKTRLSELLVQVSKGEKIAITKHGRRVAMLVPIEASPILDTTKAIEGIQALRKKIAKRGIKVSVKEILEMKEIGRK